MSHFNPDTVVLPVDKGISAHYFPPCVAHVAATSHIKQRISRILRHYATLNGDLIAGYTARLL